MDWMNQTLEAPREGGGNSLLAPGLGNYTVVSAEVATNKWNGRNQLDYRITGPGGSTTESVPLEPWDPAKVDTFVKMFTNNLGNLGIDVEGKTPVQILATLEDDARTLAGNVIECNVVHSDRKPKPDGSHLKDDGTPWQDQKVYINRLVSRAPQAAPAPAMTGVAAAFDPFTPDSADPF
jgi:hypothetical protein